MCGRNLASCYIFAVAVVKEIACLRRCIPSSRVRTRAKNVKSCSPGEGSREKKLIQKLGRLAEAVYRPVAWDEIGPCNIKWWQLIGSAGKPRDDRLVFFTAFSCCASAHSANGGCSCSGPASGAHWRKARTGLKFSFA